MRRSLHYDLRVASNVLCPTFADPPDVEQSLPYQSPRSDRKSRPAKATAHPRLSVSLRTRASNTKTLQHPWLSSCSNISYSNPSLVSSSPSFDSHQTNATPFYPPSLLVSSSVSPLAKVNSPSIRSLPVVRFFPQDLGRLATHRCSRLATRRTS